MKRLGVTLIDVGWGDSILIESEDSRGNLYFALVDSNDNAEMRSSYIFLRRHFEKLGKKIEAENKPFFEFVLLSHAHTDHGRGLESLMREFGTKRFLYPKFHKSGICGKLINYARRSTNVEHFQSVDHTDAIALGSSLVTFLWPLHNAAPEKDTENNNSVIMRLQLGDVSFLLTGDAKKEVWKEIAASIPEDTLFFKVPHHGSVNGTLRENNQPAWLDDCPRAAKLGISSHVTPHPHPHRQVIHLFNRYGMDFYRTDINYHLIFETDGRSVTVKYSH